MIGDIACLGICIVDPETGICQGCGRGPEEVSGVAAEQGGIGACNKIAAAPLSAENPVRYPLPPQVAREAANPTD